MGIINWIKDFNVTKAVILAILSIVGSWYDLRGDVSLLKQEAVIRWEKQDQKDAEQDAYAREQREELRDAIKDLKRTIIETNRNARH